MSAKKPPTVSAKTDRFIREMCGDLDGRYDREALRLICGVGVFAVDDPSQISDAVERLVTPAGHLEKVVAAQERIANANNPEARSKALSDLDILQGDQLIRITDSAYLLGIAVGRRLGPSTLKLKGGPR